MTNARFQRLRHRLLSLVRLTGTAVALASIGVFIFLGRDWLTTFGPGRLFFGHAAAALLTMLLAIYPMTAAAATVGLGLSLRAFARSRSGADSPARWLRNGRAARWSLLCGTTLLLFGSADAAAGAWLGWIRSLRNSTHRSRQI
jgi:hypothetical protein